MSTQHAPSKVLEEINDVRRNAWATADPRIADGQHQNRSSGISGATRSQGRATNMSMRRTPPLSLEGSREVIEEMKRPPEDTPERRATFQRAKEMHRFVEEIFRSPKQTSKA